MEEQETLQRFEDIEDMMDYSQQLLQDAIFHYCLTTKLGLCGIEKKVVKALLLSMVEIEFEDTHDRVIPYVEKEGNSTFVYGLYKKDN